VILMFDYTVHVQHINRRSESKDTVQYWRAVRCCTFDRGLQPLAGSWKYSSACLYNLAHIVIRCCSSDLNLETIAILLTSRRRALPVPIFSSSILAFNPLVHCEKSHSTAWTIRLEKAARNSATRLVRESRNLHQNIRFKPRNASGVILWLFNCIALVFRRIKYWLAVHAEESVPAFLAIAQRLLSPTNKARVARRPDIYFTS
jgi:hypothetical protein